MTKKIDTIAIFIDFDIDTATGREHVEHASIQIRDEEFEIIEHVGLGLVVRSEADLWDQVHLTVQRVIERGYEVDSPEVKVFRSHRSKLGVDYYEAIGQHI